MEINIRVQHPVNNISNKLIHLRIFQQQSLCICSESLNNIKIHRPDSGKGRTELTEKNTQSPPKAAPEIYFGVRVMRKGEKK